jgi:hypothetical protein
MALPNFGKGNAELFASKRAGRPETVIDPKTYEQVHNLLAKDGLVQGQDFYTASKAETEAFNGQRETYDKTNGHEIRPAITIAAMATRKARQAANLIQPYVLQAIDTSTDTRIHGKAASLRFVNSGTEDNPSVLWAFVLVSPRVRAPKATPEAPATT